MADTTAAAPRGLAGALQGLGRLSTLRQVGLLVALAASVALGVTVALWSQTPSYTLLYGSLSGKDAGEVLAALDAAGMPYRVEQDSGAILVPSADVHEARLRLAGEGLPRGTDLGFRILEEKSSFGTSQFMEQARYQHALEVELGRTVASLNAVESARVHLALPKEPSFLRGRREPSASVLVKLYPGRRLEADQSGAVAHLVAAAIPNLEPAAVRVVDEKGRLLTSGDETSPLAASNEALDYRQRLENAYRDRIESILAPIVGAEGVRAQVTAELDFTRTEQARERFTPNDEAVRSERVLEERSSAPGVGGVPGALSNQPPGVAAAPEVAAGEPEQGEGEASAPAPNTRRESVRNFELDRLVDHSVSSAARLERLSVAVVIDHREVVGEEGTSERVPLAEEELARLTALVKEAIGFDEARGDRVNVVNASFALPEPPETLPEPPLWKQAWVHDLAKQAGGALLVLLVAFGVLRPFMRNLVHRDLAERELESRAEQAQLTGPEESPGLLAHGARGGDYLSRVEALRSLAAEDPRRVASVVKTWVEDRG